MCNLRPAIIQAFMSSRCVLELSHLYCIYFLSLDLACFAYPCIFVCQSQSPPPTRHWVFLLPLDQQMCIELCSMHLCTASSVLHVVIGSFVLFVTSLIKSLSRILTSKAISSITDRVFPFVHDVLENVKTLSKIDGRH